MTTEYDNIAIARRKLDELRFQVAVIRLQLALRAFNPNQPRWPAGRPDGGQWRPAGGSEHREASYNPANETRCNVQKLLDEEICRAVRSRECWSMVMERWDACMRDVYLPPLRVGP